MAVEDVKVVNQILFSRHRLLGYAYGKHSFNPINANIVLKRIFNGKLADMFSDGLANSYK